MLAVSCKRPEIAEFGEIVSPLPGMLPTVTNLLDIFLRSAGLAFGMVLVLVVGARGGWRQRADLLALVGCACAYLICAAPSRPCCSSPATLPLVLGAIGFPFALWRLARVVLADDARIPASAWAGLAVLLTSGVLAAVDYLEAPLPWRMSFAAVNKALAFGFVAAALVAAWRSWEGDLVETRRRLRWMLVTYLGIYGLVVLIAEVYLLGRPAPPWIEATNAGLIALTLLATLLFLAGVRTQAIETLFAPAREALAPRARDADEALLARLRALMDGEKAYRDPDLSVAALAARLAAPEYVLRRLIHDRLGHRNFAAFVNEYRLREVSLSLADPAADRRPILTLALESGFGSIGPFNRAFRERYGITPTQYRSSHGAGAPTR
jgi:AraC-like DNA-binding protein